MAEEEVKEAGGALGGTVMGSVREELLLHSKYNRMPLISVNLGLDII